MMNKLTGGIIAYVMKDNKPTYYYAENSVWLLDDWHRQIIDMTYWMHIAEFKVDIPTLPFDFLAKNLPKLILDFDQKILINNYFDQAFEDRIPEGWQGVWMEHASEFLNRIPVQNRYWDHANRVRL